MKNKIIGVLLVAMVLFSLTSVLAHTGEIEETHHEGMYGMMSGTYGLGMGVIGWLFVILVIVALVLLIVWLVKQIQKK